MKENVSVRVFYNSACPVCDAGIASQMKKGTKCGVEWQDVHTDNELVKALNVELEYVRQKLHVIDTEGNLHVGYDAFIAIWENTHSEQWKARLSSLPVIKPCLNLCYDGVAWCLYRWNRAKKHW